jgi:putative nucleotidyltransferase with HDIG domain
MEADARAFVQRARELPVMPPVAAEVIRKAEDPDSELHSIAQLIARDTSLAVRVLKIANSSFYSMPRKVETLQQAIVLLGFSTLRSVVVAASMKEVFARFGLAERLLWEHAVAAGVAAGTIARHVGGFSRDEVFVGGLVHDIGKLVMHAEAETRYQEVMRMVYGEEKDSIGAEREVFGFDHAEVGRLILEKWELSPRLAGAVGAHHDLELATSAPEGAKPLAALLQLADLVCLREGLGRRKPNPELDPMRSRGAELLGLDSSDLEPVVDDFRAMHDQERQVFS